MKRRLFYAGALLILIFILMFFTAMGTNETASPLPPPPPGEETEKGTAVLAGGCFWGVEEVFQQLNGVTDVVSGYAGGKKDTADYAKVSTGRTGHAEAVRIQYDPGLISFGTLLRVFFGIAHDPTQLNYQGPDIGTQYRSVIFYTTPQQQRIAQAYIRILEENKIFDAKIVTEVLPLEKFYPAEEYHQDFMQRNPDHPYICTWDTPKLEQLKSTYPELLKTSKR